MRYAILGAAWILYLFFFIAGGCSNKGDETVVEEPPAQEQQAPGEAEPEDEPAQAAKVYKLDGANLGDYGTTVILNEDTDMPVEKHLYKLPAGKYKATTTNDKLTTFWIVKDETTIEEGNDAYPEVLQYVGEEQDLTAGNNDFGGRAKKEVTVTIADDESILLPTDKDSIIIEEVLD